VVEAYIEGICVLRKAVRAEYYLNDVVKPQVEHVFKPNQAAADQGFNLRFNRFNLPNQMLSSLAYKPEPLKTYSISK